DPCKSADQSDQREYLCGKLRLQRGGKTVFGCSGSTAADDVPQSDPENCRFSCRRVCENPFSGDRHDSGRSGKADRQCQGGGEPYFEADGKERLCYSFQGRSKD